MILWIGPQDGRASGIGPLKALDGSGLKDDQKNFYKKFTAIGIATFLIIGAFHPGLPVFRQQTVLPGIQTKTTKNDRKDRERKENDYEPGIEFE